VESRDPLWSRPGLRDEVDRGEHYLPGSATGRRETLVTNWATAHPEYVAVLPGPGWPPVLAAIGTAAFFLLLTVQLPRAAVVGGVLAVTMILVWAWGTDPGPGVGPVEVARDAWLPTYVTGRRAHSWWAMIVVVAVLGTTFASLVFSYAYLWLVELESWRPAVARRPSGHWPAMAAVAWLGSSGLVAGAGRALAAGRTGRFRLWLGLGLGLVLLAIAFDGVSQVRAGLAPDRHAYEAMVATFIGIQAVTAGAVLIMAVYTLARSWCGLLDRARRVTLDNTTLLWQYTVAQGVLALGLVHVVPWILR
jgi:cytochrome c oxidase subunit I+III